MAYERQYYTNGDVLEARQLNHMESGIKENSDNIDKLSEDIATKASAIKEKASGEVIVATDSAEAKPLGLAIDGKSEQNQYSGANLFDVNDVLNASNRFSVDEMGWLHFELDNTKTDIEYSNFYTKKSVLLKPNISYLVVAEVESIENCELKVVTNAHQYPSQFNTEKNTSKSGVFLWVLNTKESFDTSETMLRTFTKVPPGVIGSAKFRISVLEDISVTADTFVYEPYCGGIPSPNPSYPQEIRNIGVYDEASGKYAVEIKCAGKNLLDCIKLGVKTSKGITFTPVYTEDGLLEYIEANGTSEGGNAIYAISNSDSANGQAIYEALEGKKVIISGSTGGSSTTHGLQFWSETKIIRSLNGDSNADIIPTNLSLWNISIVINEGVTTNKLCFYPMIRYADVEDYTYEPYKETTATVYLDEPLRGIGEYRDTICQKDGVWGVERKISITKENKWVLTSVKDTTTGHRFRTDVPIIKENHIPVLSNYYLFKSVSSYDTEGDYVATNETANNGRIFVRTLQKDFSTASEFEAFIEENGVEFYYPLAEPTFTPLADQTVFDGLSMFYPTTILSNDCNANMEVTYIADTKAYIDKKFAELATAMV